MTSRRGKLIVFEGLDRSGKSTQCERLAQHLRDQGQQVEHMRFPNRSTPIGQMINNYLSGQSQQEDHVIHLLFSANRWESAAAIDELLKAGTTVVIDRYYYSGCAYTAAKQTAGLDLQWCRHPEVGLPRPDLCLFLDVSAEEAAKRGGFGTERYEKEEMQARVRNLFGQMRQHRDEAEDISVVDAGRTIEEVEQSIQRCVATASDRVDEGDLGLRYVQPW